jgi:hypothetical protein
MNNDQEVMTRIISYSKRILNYMITINTTERLHQRYKNHGLISITKASFDLQLSLLRTRQEELLYKCKSLLLPLFQCRNFGYVELDQFRIPASSLIHGYLSLIEKDTNDEYILFLYEYKDAKHHILPGSLHLLRKNGSKDTTHIGPILGNYKYMVSMLPESKNIPNVLKNYFNLSP